MGKTYDNNEINSDGHVHDLLASYIDRSLEETERVRVRAHLEECVDCRADYVELQATRQMLRQMPIASVPRAFTLTPEMVKGANKASFWERIFAPRTAPTFASGAVVAFGLLLFLFVGSLFSTNGPSATSNSATTDAYLAPAEQQALRSTATEDSSVDNTTTSMMAIPTSTTSTAADSSASGGNDGAANKQASPTQSAGEASDAAGSPPGPSGMVPTQATEAPGAAYGGGSEPVPAPVITPDTNISGSGNSSPTTTSLDNPAGVGPADVDTQSGTTAFMAQQPQTPIVQKFDFFLTVEIGLLVIGLALAGAYLVARRR